VSSSYARTQVSAVGLQGGSGMKRSRRTSSSRRQRFVGVNVIDTSKYVIRYQPEVDGDVQQRSAGLVRYFLEGFFFFCHERSNKFRGWRVRWDQLGVSRKVEQRRTAKINGYPVG